MSLSVDLQGKVAVVTGASRGIGKSIAMELAKSGATVIGTATSARGTDAIQSYLDAYNGLALELNVSSTESIDLFFKALNERSLSVDILVNNAGITRDNLMMRMKDDEWDDVISTNLTSIYRLSKQVLRPMMKKRAGRIINIGSVVGTTGNAGQVNYCSAKAGLEGFTKALAQEVASRHITVNNVAPGFIQTDMTEQLTDAQKSDIFSQIPMARMGLPEEIAQAVLFLASDASTYITGQTFHVNGGMHM